MMILLLTVNILIDSLRMRNDLADHLKWGWL